MKNIIDTSALIQFFQKEEGWEKVQDVITEDCYISIINLTEFFTWIVRNNMSLSDVEEVVKLIGIKIVKYEYQQVLEVAKIYHKCKHYGLSLGDRACLALGLTKKINIVTADRVWQKLNLDISITCTR